MGAKNLDVELLLAEEKKKDLIAQWIVLSRERENTRGRVTMEEKLIKYKLGITDRALRSLKQNMLSRNEVSSPKFRQELRRREKAVEDSELRISSLNNEIAKITGGASAMDIDLLKDLNRAIGNEKKTLGARNNSLWKFEQRHGLHNDEFKKQASDRSSIVENTPLDLPRGVGLLTEIPSDFDYLTSPDYDMKKTASGAKIATEVNLNDLSAMFTNAEDTE